MLCQGQCLFQELNANLASFTHSYFTAINSLCAECDGAVSLDTVWGLALLGRGWSEWGSRCLLPAGRTFLPLLI